MPVRQPPPQPGLSLPQGGGAIRGLGESFQPTAFSGTATFSVPLYTTPGRGFDPTLALTYNSASGNGPYGLGFTVEVPFIGRQTRLRVPRYDDTDTFVFSAAGDLVPALRLEDGAWVPDARTVTEDGVAWTVRAYASRVEGGSGRVERWTRADTGSAHWRVLSAENAVTFFGRGEPARIADPDDPLRVFQWLAEETVDARGNRVVYSWKPEDGAGVPDTLAEAGHHWRGQRYLHSIAYGNYLPAQGGAEEFAFEAVFDYGEHELSGLDRPGADPYRPVRAWPVRADPFSGYRSGFELRTLRLCRGVLMFHRFAELGPEPCLVRATRFGHEQTPTFSFLDTVWQAGYRRGDDGAYAEQALPPLTFGYSRFDPPEAPRFQPLLVPRAADLPGYLGAGAFLPVDLDGEGLPGFLYSDGSTTLYYAPLGGGAYAAPESPPAFPGVGALPADGVTVRDLDANGRLELVVETEALQGYFAHRPGGGWEPFRSFTSYPAFAGEGAVQQADLEGSGRLDLLTFHGRDLVYYPSAGTEGYGPPRTRTLVAGFPTAAAAGELEVVLFADPFGDGLQHRVRVRDGQVQVWPSLGYGRFGAPVQMANAPRFGGGVDASRIYFADVDGSGAVDLVFAYHDRVEVYRNLSGNGFAPALTVRLPADFDDLAQLSFADVRGKGATALVLTRAEPVARHWFFEFGGAEAAAEGGGPRPAPRAYLLTGADDHLGAAVRVDYASSTQFYLEDRRTGRPWPTRLPFPVQVVERVVTTDAVSGTRSVQRYRYHDGYWDPVERELNGFGYVESWDAESYDDHARAAPAPLSAEAYVPPAYTRAWYHTGAYEDADPIAAACRAEFWHGDPLEYAMPAAYFGEAIRAADASTQRQAYRALRGMELRREVYGEDGSPRSADPFTVTQACWQVQQVQPGEDGRAAAFYVRLRERIACDYEREPADPRVQHDFVLEDTLFAPGGAEDYRVRTCTVDYPRRPSTSPDVFVYPEQAELKATAGEERRTRMVQPFRVVGLTFERRSYELSGVILDGALYLSFDQAAAQVRAALENPIAYGVPFTPGATQARTFSWEQAYFWDEAQAAALPLGRVSSRALPHHSAAAAFTGAWLEEAYSGRVDDALLRVEGGYARGDDGYWWNHGVVQHFFAEPECFYLPRETANDFAFADPAAADGLRVRTTRAYDAPYYAAEVEVREALDGETALVTRAELDYHVVQPWQLTDSNGVVSQVLYDPLGRVTATSTFKPALGGRTREGDGDLRAYVVRPEATFAAVLADKPYYLQDATTFLFYDPWAFERDTQPASTVALARQRLVSDVPPGGASPIQAQVSFSDGVERAIEAKAEADEGTGRWIASGRTVYDNKGQPAEQYLPYESATPYYEAESEGPDLPPTVNRYDPLLRPVRVDTPQGFFTRTAYQAWQTRFYDENDTVRDSAYWLAHAGDPALRPEERDTLEKAAACYNTPAVTVLGSDGAPVREVLDNLGSVAPDAFTALVAGTEVTSEQLWADLVARGYLHTSETPPAGTWLTAKFQPYVRGFELELSPAFQPFAPAVTEQLRQGVLTTWVLPDVQARTLETADPRLFHAAVTEGARARNFRYAYAMDADAPAWTDGADAGVRRVLSNVFGSPVAGWDGRGQRMEWTYDRLQRLLTTTVREEGGEPWIAEALAYGEGQPGAAADNLWGRLWRVQDQAGVQVNEAYSLAGLPARATRQLRAAYRSRADWSGEVALEPEVYRTEWSYDEQGRVTAATAPDGSTQENAYHLSGRLASLQVRHADGTVQPILTGASYAADGQERRVAYGNGAARESTYQATTRRLLRLRATGSDGGALQDAAYTYDPVGNLTFSRDATARDVFCTRQAETVGDFGYDLLYRLARATGRQHPGIEADTHLIGFKQSLFAPLCPADPADAVALEEYAEAYAYDGSGNLLSIAHTAASGSFTRESPVEPDSNRLSGVLYDGNGNPLELALLNPVGLGWDFANRLASTTPVERPDGSYDRDFFTYDTAGERVRAVVERTGADGAAARSEERISLGSYEVERVRGADATVEERRTLRVMDEGGCIAVVETGDGVRRVRWQLGDRLGSVSVALDDAAAPATWEAFFPYGGTPAIAGTDPAAVEPKRRRYSAKECDDSTGLYDYGARWYATWLGRWLTPDPSGPVDGLNLYAFVGGNPTTYLDPDGRAKEKQDTGAAPAVPAKPLLFGEERTYEMYKATKGFSYHMALSSVIAEIVAHRFAHGKGHGHGHDAPPSPSRRQYPPTLGAPLRRKAPPPTVQERVTAQVLHLYTRATQAAALYLARLNEKPIVGSLGRIAEKAHPYVGAHGLPGTFAVAGGVSGSTSALLDRSQHGWTPQNVQNLSAAAYFAGEGVAILRRNPFIAGLLGASADVLKANAAGIDKDRKKQVVYSFFAAGNLASISVWKYLPKRAQIPLLASGVAVDLVARIWPGASPPPPKPSVLLQPRLKPEFTGVVTRGDPTTAWLLGKGPHPGWWSGWLRTSRK